MQSSQDERARIEQDKIEFIQNCNNQLADLQNSTSHQLAPNTSECDLRVSQAENKCARARSVAEHFKAAYEATRRTQEQLNKDCVALQTRATEAVHKC